LFILTLLPILFEDSLDWWQFNSLCSDFVPNYLFLSNRVVLRFAIILTVLQIKIKAFLNYFRKTCQEQEKIVILSKLILGP